MSEGGVKHDYHLVDPSPWPVVGALGAFITAIGAVLWLNKGYAGFGVLAGIPWIFGIGLGLVLYTLTGWWRDVVAESVTEGAYSPVVKLGLRYGMVLLLLAETMFFAVWFWAWFYFALFPRDAGLGAWPPDGIAAVDPWHLPLLATVILLTSGTTVTWAQRAIRNADRSAAIGALVVTVVLGLAFAAVEAMQFAGLPSGFDDPALTRLAAGHGPHAAIYGSVLVMATGLSALHVLAGTAFLAVCLVRAVAGHFTPGRHFGFEAAAWYWHFVVAVWLFLFAALYVFGR